MTETDLQVPLERFVAENDELLSLEEQIGRFNIFDALGIARVEIRHSNFLAWLLTPSESHGQGDLFLKAFLMDVLRKARQKGAEPPISAVELDGADLRGVEVRREWRNIDLLIRCDKPRFVIAIENKIDSGEHGNQLERYKDTVVTGKASLLASSRCSCSSPLKEAIPATTTGSLTAMPTCTRRLPALQRQRGRRRCRRGCVPPPLS